jgi:F0F1-type ATP synthase assembly protein I
MSDSPPLRPGLDAPAAPASAGRTVTRAIISMAAGTKNNPLERNSYAGATSKGYGDAMGRGFELALSLVVIGAIGWFVDHLAGTSPIFTIAFSILGFVGVGIKLWLGYDLEMRTHDDGAVWTRPSGQGEAPNRAAAPLQTPGAASAVADQLAAHQVTEHDVADPAETSR